jgi:ABC-2 type transport system permease protein
MLRNVFLKTQRDYRRSIMWWALGLVVLNAFMVAFYPSISEIEDFETIIEAYPEDLMALFGASNLADMTSPVGFLNIELFGFTVPALFAVFAIGLGSAAIAGEESRGTIEMLLSEPITRGRLILEKFAAMSVLIVALAFALWASLVIGAAIMDMEISTLRLGEMSISTALLGLIFGGVAFAVGAVTGRRGLSMGAAASVVVAGHVLNAFSLMSDIMEPARWLSPFHYYNGNLPLYNGLDPVHVIVMVAVIAFLFAISYIGFQRRDIRL